MLIQFCICTDIYKIKCSVVITHYFLLVFSTHQQKWTQWRGIMHCLRRFYGDRQQPCLSPQVTSNQSGVRLLSRTEDTTDAYNDLIAMKSFPAIPMFSSLSHKRFLLIQSQALRNTEIWASNTGPNGSAFRRGILIFVGETKVAFPLFKNSSALTGYRTIFKDYLHWDATLLRLTVP